MKKNSDATVNLDADADADADACDAGSTWRFCVAPMMDWTDRHCRMFHRSLSKRARLYTEMITTGALLHGDASAHLRFDPREHPVALQLGGSEPAALASAASMGAGWGYDEINLNCGCPSDRVQRGAFGACLMREPKLVADCFKAMADAVTVPITVKHRLGLGRDQSMTLVTDFVGELHKAGCRHFIVHARNAWLEGLSPKDNRDIPPLRYDDVYRLAQAFRDSHFILNGGLSEHQQAFDALHQLSGVMIGRAAYQNPALLADVDRLWFGLPVQLPSGFPPNLDVLIAAMEQYRHYMLRQLAIGVPLASMTRHILGLFQGRPGARLFRRDLSDQHAMRTQGIDWFDASLSRFLTVQRTEEM